MKKNGKKILRPYQPEFLERCERPCKFHSLLQLEPNTNELRLAVIVFIQVIKCGGKPNTMMGCDCNYCCSGTSLTVLVVNLMLGSRWRSCPLEVQRQKCVLPSWSLDLLLLDQYQNADPENQTISLLVIVTCRKHIDVVFLTGI